MSKDFLSNLKAQDMMKSKVFWNPSQSITGFKNFRGGYIGCLNIIEDKALDAGLTKCKGHSQLRRESQVRRKNGISTKREFHHKGNTRVGFKHWTRHSRCSSNASLSSTMFCIKREPVSSAFQLGCDLEKPVSSAFNNRARSASNARPAFLL